MSSVISNTKILAHLDRVVGSQRPITADVFLDNYCNNNCPYCAYKRWELDNDARYMSFDDFKKYAERLKELGVLGIILSGGGEPSISRDFKQIIGWMDENGYKWGINTNFVKYFDGHPQYLKVSLDAYSRETYKANRGIDAYDTVRENIIRFSKNKGNTQLGIQLLAKSEFDVYRFYEANADLPVDYISIRPVESTGGQYYNSWLPRDARPKHIIHAIKDLMSCDKRIVLNYKWELLKERQNECTAQWSQIAVNEVGEVMYCCHKPYQIVGHIMDDDILEKKRKAMTDMKMCDIPCRLTAPNKMMAEIQAKQTNPEFI